MGLEAVSAGKNAPEEVNVIIEIAKDSEPVKYEVDKDSSVLWVDRVLSTAMHYPANYGYVPNTLCGDGDPADVLVLMPHPVVPGSVIKARPIGYLKMSDEAGSDEKLIAVPNAKIFPAYADITDLDQAPKWMLDQIAHFFEHYKDLEKGKWVKIDGWGNAEEARAVLVDAVARYEGKSK